MCSSEDRENSVLGIDRTFNLCDVFVTVTSFKCKTVLRKESKNHPIFIGPIFLHGSATHDVYDLFFSHLASCFGPERQKRLVVGTDDERAMRRAIAEKLPLSSNVLCTRHLKSNVDDFLKNKVGLTLGQRQEVVQALFGPSGVVCADDSLIFDERLKGIKDLCQTWSADSTSFIKYLENRLEPLLRKGVFETCRDHGIERQWTNNNSESVNHILKNLTEWKSLPLTELIGKLESLLKAQEKDLRRAIVGQGNYILAPEMKHHAVPLKTWMSLSQTEKDKRTNKLIARQGARNPQKVTSTDGTLTVTNTASKGKKPNQRKRKRSERSVTIPKKEFNVSIL